MAIDKRATRLGVLGLVGLILFGLLLLTFELLLLELLSVVQAAHVLPFLARCRRAPRSR